MYDFVNNIIGIVNILIIAVLFYLLFTFIFAKKYYNRLSKIIFENKYLIGTVIGVGAMIASLYYSEIIGFAPCNLCWILRIAIYPTAIFFAYSYLRKHSGFEKYAKLILWPALLFSFLHNYLYYTGTTSAFCDAAVSCTEKYVDIFGFLSIPLLGLISVITLIYLVSIKKSD